MNYNELIQKYPSGVFALSDVLPLFGSKNSAIVTLSRWKRSKKLIKLRNGLYLLPKLIRKTEPFDLSIASMILNPSYVSMEKAMEYYGLIPEAVFVNTMVTTRRQNSFKNSLGTFRYFHIKTEYFFGYKTEIVGGQTAYIAFPEKAILDLIYFKHPQITKAYFWELRLQNVHVIDKKKLLQFSKRYKSRKIRMAAKMIVAMINEGAFK